MAIVYLHKKKGTDEVFYVGIGKTEKRAFEEKNRNQYWKNVLHKYGFDVVITHKNICWEEACVIEKYLIAFYRNYFKLCNLTDGGQGILGFKKSDEMKNNSRIGMLGKRNSLGTKRSKETIEKIRQKNLGKKRSDDFKIKMSRISVGRVITDDIKNKISKSLKVRGFWIGKSGIKHNHSKSVNQYNSFGELLNQFGSTREAKRITGISHISCCCNGQRKSAGGFFWKYA